MAQWLLSVFSVALMHGAQHAKPELPEDLSPAAPYRTLKLPEGRSGYVINGYGFPMQAISCT